MLTVRRAVQAEFDVIMGIYRIAQDFMIRTGNPNQWKHSDPAPEQIEADIENGIWKRIQGPFGTIWHRRTGAVCPVKGI